MKIRKALTFDDILLVPRHSDIRSIDKEIDTSTRIGHYTLDIPIISAAMDTVTDKRMQRSMRHLGGLGIHHRYISEKEREKYASLTRYGPIAVSPSMGIEFINNMAKDLIAHRQTVAIDVAHGDRQEALDYAEYCHGLGLEVWSGNICTLEAALRYDRIGVNILKVGIGPGSSCSTRINTGCGYPQASAIYDIHNGLIDAKKMVLDGLVIGKRIETTIIADGGIKTAGDIVKALALGADAVIIGGLVAGTDESPGHIVIDENTGIRYKEYWGMASETALRQNKKTLRIEGVSGRVPYTGPMENVLNRLVDGVKLGMAYVGARSIKELQENAEFVEITQSGQREGLPRI